MPQYECAVVFSTTLSEEELQGQVEQVKAWIAGTGAAVTDVDLWGRRRLAYPVNKQYDGYYVIYYFTLDQEGTRLGELDRRFQTAEAVMRHLVLRLPALKEPPRVPKEEEEPVAAGEGEAEEVAAGEGEAEEAPVDQPEDGEQEADDEGAEAEAEPPAEAGPLGDSEPAPADVEPAEAPDSKPESSE